MPVIFVTGHWDVAMTVKAMKAGAIEFLTKPVSDDVLLVAVEEALARSRQGNARDMEIRRSCGIVTHRSAAASRRSWPWWSQAC